ncbi:MAG: 30S ribosomal protein S20 [Candidatus Omnitrophica bacterium]|nr:30S ribosomal protein S20 [Candidatus Omnitrophota bacterium]MBU4457129.1 30S ribosomal protein S20 [Candidatus Omnitrophota bacterium]
MPILHAAYKAIKVTKRRAARNQSVGSRLKTETKKFIDLIASKKLDQAKTQLNKLISELDRASSKGVIHRKKASRKKSRLMKRLKSASTS